jgi:hypothetical protein
VFFGEGKGAEADFESGFAGESVVGEGGVEVEGGGVEGVDLVGYQYTCSLM